MNGTLREIGRRAEDFRARAGVDLAGIWISQERWNLLPQAVRDGHSQTQAHWRPASHPGVLRVSGVPVQVLQVLEPAEAFTRAPGSRPQGENGPSAGYRHRPAAGTGL